MTLTTQQIFNRAVTGVLSQGGPSVRHGRDHTDEPSVFCLYRSPNGRRCAAGWVIPDELYKEDMESNLAGNVFRRPALAGLVTGVGCDLLQRLQDVHDGLANTHQGDDDTFLDAFRTDARIVAAEFNLTTEALSHD